MMKQMHYHSRFPRGSFVPWSHSVFFRLLFAAPDSILDSFHKEIYLSDSIAFTHLLPLVVFGRGVVYPQHRLVVENVEGVNPKRRWELLPRHKRVVESSSWCCWGRTCQHHQTWFLSASRPSCYVSFCRKPFQQVPLAFRIVLLVHMCLISELNGAADSLHACSLFLTPVFTFNIAIHRLLGIQNIWWMQDT